MNAPDWRKPPFEGPAEHEVRLNEHVLHQPRLTDAERTELISRFRDSRGAVTVLPPFVPRVNRLDTAVRAFLALCSLLTATLWLTGVQAPSRLPAAAASLMAAAFIAADFPRPRLPWHRRSA